MTGQNKYVLSVFSKLIRIDKKNLILMRRNEVLNKYDIRHLAYIGIPVVPLNFKTKQQVLDYILNEVVEFIPTAKTLWLRNYQKQ